MFHFCTWVISFLEPWLATGFSVYMMLDKYPPFCIILAMTVFNLLFVHWAETNFGQPYLLVHWSSRECFASVVVGWGCLKQVPRKPSIHGRQSRPWAPWSRTPRLYPSPEGLGLSSGAWGAPFLRGMLMGLKKFLGHLNVSGPQSCAWYHQ